MILKTKKSYFEEEIDKIRNKPKELWKALKSLVVSSYKGRKSKISLQKDVAIQFEGPESAIIFKRLYSELTGDLEEKLSKAPNKFTSQTIKNYYAKTSCNVPYDFELSNVFEEVIKNILLSLDTSKAAGPNSNKISERRCKSIGSSFEKYNKFVSKTINLIREV